MILGNETLASSLSSLLLGGIASAGKLLGRAIAKTPVGDHTLIDETFEDAGEDIGRFNDRQSEKLLEKLHQAKTPDVAPFKQSVKEIDTLYNRPTQIAVDAENVYILPAKQQEE